MKAIEWKEKIIAHTQMEREIRNDVARVYYVQIGEYPISTAIIINLDDDGKVLVRASQGYYGTDAHHTNYIDKVENLDIPTMEALARTRIQVERWFYGDRDELPSADELDLIDKRDNLPKSRFLF
ncbi:hypothetical protein LCGC14_1600850 [marine sediment metagenome]|uniref:Uncharacterized protein n=1 Tax=marine sediment metagenome TaxID=412755 RepID=A0A0F9LB80_9ZZZZ